MAVVLSYTPLDLSGDGNFLGVAYDNFAPLTVTTTDVAFRYTLGGAPVMDAAMNGRFIATSSGAFYGSIAAISARYPGGGPMIEIGGINQGFSSLNDFGRILTPSVMLGKADVLYGSDYADKLYSQAGNDVVFAGSGNDTINGGSGSDVIDGGAGIDLAITGTSYAATRVVRSGGRVVVLDGYGAADSHTNVEYLQFTNGTLATSAVPAFDSLSYIASYPDLIQAYGLNPEMGFNHYVQWGYAAGRRAGGFDALSYLASHPDLVSAYGLDEQAATAHYIQWGKPAGWGVSFNPQSYMRANPDVAAAVSGDTRAATVNYILWGRAGGRPTSTTSSANAAPTELQAGADRVVTDGATFSAAGAVTVPPAAASLLADAAPWVPVAPWGEAMEQAATMGMAGTEPLLAPLAGEAWNGAGALTLSGYVAP